MFRYGVGHVDVYSKHQLFYVVGQLGAGGLERQLFYLLDALKQLMYSPGLAVWRFNPLALYVAEIKALGVPIYPLSSRAGAWGRMMRLRSLVHEIRPRVLHSMSFHTNFPAWLAMRGIDGVVVGSVRNEYRQELKDAGLLRGWLSARLPRSFVVNNQCSVNQMSPA